MNFQPQPVAQRVSERVAKATVVDHRPGKRVDFPPRHSRPHPGDRLRLRLAHEFINAALALIGSIAHQHGSSDVRAVSIYLRPKVKQQPFSRLNRTISRMCVRQRTPRS